MQAQSADRALSSTCTLLAHNNASLHQTEVRHVAAEAQQRATKQGGLWG